MIKCAVVPLERNNSMLLYYDVVETSELLVSKYFKYCQPEFNIIFRNNCKFDQSDMQTISRTKFTEELTDIFIAELIKVDVQYMSNYLRLLDFFNLCNNRFIHYLDNLHEYLLCMNSVFNKFVKHY